MPSGTFQNMIWIMILNPILKKVIHIKNPLSESELVVGEGDKISTEKRQKQKYP